MPKEKEVYEWRKNNACVATYNVLEGDNFLDQFEDVDISFDDAPDVTMDKLRYFPRSTGNANLIGVLGNQMARKFLKFVSKTFTLEKQQRGQKTADFVEALTAVFGNKKGTVRDLARILDENVEFPDES